MYDNNEKAEDTLAQFSTVDYETRQLCKVNGKKVLFFMQKQPFIK